MESWIGGDRNALFDFAKRARDLGLRLGGGGYLRVEDSAEPAFALAAEAGAKYLELQVDGYWKDDAWIVARTLELMKLGETHGVPFFLETHRGRYTQDMRRTLWLLEANSGVESVRGFQSLCEFVRMGGAVGGGVEGAAV